MMGLRGRVQRTDLSDCSATYPSQFARGDGVSVTRDVCHRGDGVRWTLAD